jgi:hypothetical protein
VTDLLPVLGAIRDGLDRAVAYADELARVATSAAAALPAVAERVARAELDTLRRAVTDVHARLTALLDVPGHPVTLRTAGSAWVHEVCGPVSQLAGLASANTMQTDDRWTGAAADAYRGALLAQQAALVAVAAAGQEVDAVLADLAGAVTKFWIVLGTACIVMVVALAAALAAAGTVAGAPLASGTAVAAVGALAAAGNSALAGLTDLTVVAAARTAALERRLADSAAFPLGSWPRSTTSTDGWAVR